MTEKFASLKLVAMLLSLDCLETFTETTIETTTPLRTTIPTTLPGGCFHNGRNYANGETIEEDPYYNCYGTYCDYGGILNWDAKCFFYTPYCNGRSEKVLGECCPLCHNMTTTAPTTIPPSSTPQGGCVYEGEIYANGEYVKQHPNNCSGAKCEHGVVNTWETNCWYHPNVCKGEWRNITGQCCKVCVNVTTPQPESTTPTTGPPQRCRRGNIFYDVGQRTNKDPCNVCTCTIDGTESCFNITCDDTVLDCEVKYRPEGTCCYTCGSSQVTTSLLLMLTIFWLFKENLPV